MYLQDNSLRLAETTLKSRKAHLEMLYPIALHFDEDASKVFDHLVGKVKAYTLKTYFVSLSNFYEWGIKNGFKQENPWKKEVSRRGQFFKHAYQPKKINVTYEEAAEKINQISDREVRETASEILRSGLRAFETGNINDGKISGKGGKVRTFFGDQEKVHKISYYKLRRGLAEVGLKPHDLRKLFATRLARSGEFDEITLMNVMGWSSFETAKSYLQPDKENVIASKLSRILS